MAKTHVMGWSFNTQLNLSVTGHDRRLVVAVAQIPGTVGWSVIALESADANTGSIDAIFEDHSHASLPEQRDVQSAIALAEKYAEHWQRNRETAREACACEEIAAPRTKRRRAG